MAKFTFDTGTWVEEITRDFDQADKHIIAAQKAALYEGAGVLADAATAAANAYGLGAGLGISKMEETPDGVNTSVGFRKEGDAGYFINRWGQKTPYDLVANVLEYGSSRVPATHFFSRAVKSQKDTAKAVMRMVFLEQMNKYLGE